MLLTQTHFIFAFYSPKNGFFWPVQRSRKR